MSTPRALRRRRTPKCSTWGKDDCLLPGLIDAYVHLADASTDVVVALGAVDDSTLLA